VACPSLWPHRRLSSRIDGWSWCAMARAWCWIGTGSLGRGTATTHRWVRLRKDRGCLGTGCQGCTGPRRAASACWTPTPSAWVHVWRGPSPHQRSPAGSSSPVRATGPHPWRGDLECGEGSAWGERQGATVRPAEGQVAHHLWHLDDADDGTGGRDHPKATRADAPHPPRRSDFAPVRDAGSRGGHLAAPPMVAQAAIRGHVKGTDMAVRADLATRFFLDAPRLQPTDRHGQDGHIGQERQPIGVRARVGRAMDLALRIATKHPGKAEFPRRRRQTQRQVGEKRLPSERHTTS
jgi:hypothetical protein